MIDGPPIWRKQKKKTLPKNELINQLIEFYNFIEFFNDQDYSKLNIFSTFSLQF